jgi:hypothetical protein
MALSGGPVQIQNDPIYSLPHLYISGLNVSVASTTILAIAPGQARDSSDNIDMPVGFPTLQGNIYPAPLFINAAVNGANGLDQGTLATAQAYAVWLIGDSRGYNPVAGLLSLASNAFPLVPSGYDSLRLLAFLDTSGGALVNTNLALASEDEAFYKQPPVSVLASAAGDTAFHAISLAAAGVPASPVYGIAILTVNYTPAAAGDTVVFRYTGSTATSGLVTITGLAAGVPQQNQIQVVYANQSIDYKCSSASDGLSVLLNGWIIATA